MSRRARRASFKPYKLGPVEAHFIEVLTLNAVSRNGAVTRRRMATFRALAQEVADVGDRAVDLLRDARLLAAAAKSLPRKLPSAIGHDLHGDALAALDCLTRLAQYADAVSAAITASAHDAERLTVTSR